MTAARGKTGILLSGRGSNFEAIYQQSRQSDSNYRVSAVISDRSRAPGLSKAEGFGIPRYHVSRKKFRSKEKYEERIVEILHTHDVELVCLAGYMKIVGPVILGAFPGRIMNIHPALLPAFPGLDAQEQALQHGVKVSGCTVHFVDSGVDTGPIIQQASVPVREEDTTDTLSQRILQQEHRIYSRAIRLFFDGRLQIEGRRVRISS